MNSLLLKNAAVLKCDGSRDDRPTPGEILIEDNRIAAVGERLEACDTRARTIDCRGATVMPGLGDAHTHISWPLDFVFDHAGVAAEDPARHALDVAAVTATFLKSGYTTIVGAGVLQEGDDIQARGAIEHGYVLGPRIFPSGRMVAGKGGLGDGDGLMEVADGAQSMREIVARQCDQGVRAVKLFISGDNIVPGHPSDDIYMDDAMVEAAVTEADRHGGFVTAHARGAASVAMAARTGVRIIHHACYIDDEALRELENRGDHVWVCPGLHYLWATVNGHAERWGLTAERIRACGYDEELQAQIAGIRAMTETGVPLVAGGDFGHQWTHHGTYAAELQRYVDECGLSPIAAIHTATCNFSGLLDEKIGVIEEGFIADLLVIEGDPVADISILQHAERPRIVLKDGELAYVHPGWLARRAVHHADGGKLES